MKKLNLLCILAVVFTLFSCGSDDENTMETINVNFIVKKWYLIEVNDLSKNDCELLSTLDIKADGTYEEQVYNSNFNTGDCTTDTINKGTWIFSGTILSLTLDKPENVRSLLTKNTVLELTATSLKLEFEHRNDDGTTLRQICTYSSEKPVPNISDDNSTETTEISVANLIGKWQFDSVTEDGKELPSNECLQMDFIEFYIRDEKQIVVFTDHYYADCTPVTSIDYLWKLSEDNLTIENNFFFPRFTDSYRIITLNNTTLKLEFKGYLPHSQTLVRTLNVITYKKT